MVKADICLKCETLHRFPCQRSDELPTALSASRSERRLIGRDDREPALHTDRHAPRDDSVLVQIERPVRRTVVLRFN